MPKALINPQKIKANEISSSSNKIIETSTTNNSQNKSSEKVSNFDTSNTKVTNISADGKVTLSIKSDVNIISSLKNNVNTLEVQLKSIEKDSSRKPIEKMSPESALTGILNSLNSAKKDEKNKNDSVIKKSVIDITSTISNKDAHSLSTASLDDAKQILKQKIVLSTVSTEDSGKHSSNIPILQTPTNKSTNIAKSEDKSDKQIMFDMILKDGKSPANMSKGELSFNSSENAIAGVSNRNKSNINLRNSQTQESHRKNNLAGTILKGQVKDISSADELDKKNSNQSNTVVVVNKEIEEKKTIKKDITLSIDDVKALNENFILTVGDGTEKSNTSGHCVNLTEKILDYLFDNNTPAESLDEKSINVSNTKNNFNVTNINKNEKKESIDSHIPASGIGGGTQPNISIFTKSFSPFEQSNSWQSEGTIQSNDKSTLKKIATPGGSTKLVRAISVGHSPYPPGFTEIVVQSNSRHLTSTPSAMGNVTAETDNRFCSVSAFLRKGGITVRLGNIQSSYQAMIVKKDLTLHDKNFKVINAINPIRIVDETTHEEIFIDTDVKENHIYEYRCIFYTRMGRKMFGTGYCLIKFNSLIDNAAIVNVTQPVMSINNDGDIDISFNVTADLSDTNISILVDILSNLGLEKYFTTDITENRNKLKNVIVYGIDRVNLTTGEINNFGIFKGGDFSDINDGILNNVSQVKINNDYRYVISVLSRDSESLVASIQRTTKNLKTNNDYSFYPSKSLHPITLKYGMIRSDSNIKKTNIVDEFLAGFTGVQIFVDITTKTTKPTIDNGTCTKNSRGNNELRWKLTGKQDQVDHFVITCEQLNMRSIVGRSHNMSTNNSYTFEDKIYSQLAGDTTYFVRPVFSDYTFGDELKIGTVQELDSKTKVI